MKVTTFIEFDANEFRKILEEAMAPLKAEIEILRTKITNTKHAYTVAEVAEKIGYSTKSICRFIKEGRPGRKCRVYLKAHEITVGDYRITPADLDAFIKSF